MAAGVTPSLWSVEELIGAALETSFEAALYKYRRDTLVAIEHRARNHEQNRSRWRKAVLPRKQVLEAGASCGGPVRASDTGPRRC